MKWIAVLALAAVAVLISTATVAVRQAGKVHSFQPATAEIMTSAVRTSEGTRRRSYWPEIHYLYKVRETTYESSTIFPTDTQSTPAEANRIVGQYPPGTSATAYYNPANPREAFLVREISLVPYGLALAAVVFATVATFTQVPGNQDYTPRFKGFGLKVLAVAWLAVGALAATHYYAVADQPKTEMGVALGVFAAGAAVIVFLAIRFRVHSADP